MQYFECMQVLQSDQHFHKDSPDVFFFEKETSIFMFDNLLVEISVINELHDNTVLKMRYQRLLLSRNTCL